MSNFLALTSRELKSLWYSPIAYVVGALFLLMQGGVFWLLLTALNDPRMNPSWTMAQFYFGGSFFYWFSAMFTAPLLTMRTFSEEKHSGTMETLLAAPVTDTQIVLSKFFGAWIAYNILWSLTIVFFCVLRMWTIFDWGPVLTGYLGTWLLGAVLVAIGILASSLTRNQVVAAVMSFVALMFLFSIGFLPIFIHDPETVKLIQYLSVSDHLESFSKGLIDTRPMIFYLSVCGICLFLTKQAINVTRWRA